MAALLEVLIDQKYVALHQEDGEMVVVMKAKMQETLPEVCHAMEILESDIEQSLWHKGFVELVMDEEGEGALILNMEKARKSLSELTNAEYMKLRDMFGNN